MGSNEMNNQDLKRAIDRITKLVDADSFSQILKGLDGANVLAGFATIDGRICYVYCQCGAVNKAHAVTISRVYEMAVTMGAPVIGILDSKGMETEEGLEILAAYGQIFKTMSDASGVIPQFSLVLGDCMGTASIITGLSDFVFSTADAKLFIQSPNTIEDVKRVGLDKIFTGSYQSTTGEVDFVYEDEIGVITGFKQFLGFMPSNNLEEPPIIMVSDDYAKPMDYLKNISHDSEYDMEKIVSNLVDNGEFIEVAKAYGTQIKVYFARFEGFSTAILANNGLLSADAIKKMTEMITFCDAFNLPIVSLSDVSGFSAELKDQKHSIRNAAALGFAWANATVAKINIIVKNAVGCPSVLCNSLAIGADLVYAWPAANVGLFNVDAASKVLNEDSKGVSDALLKGYIDDVIEPDSTRKAIISAIDALATKRIFKHPKKHGSICF